GGRRQTGRGRSRRAPRERRDLDDRRLAPVALCEREVEVVAVRVHVEGLVGEQRCRRVVEEDDGAAFADDLVAGLRLFRELELERSVAVALVRPGDAEAAPLA